MFNEKKNDVDYEVRGVWRGDFIFIFEIDIERLGTKNLKREALTAATTALTSFPLSRTVNGHRRTFFRCPTDWKVLGPRKRQLKSSCVSSHRLTKVHHPLPINKPHFGVGSPFEIVQAVVPCCLLPSAYPVVPFRYRALPFASEHLYKNREHLTSFKHDFLFF